VTATPSRGSRRSSTPNCAASPADRWGASAPATPCKPPRSSTRHICGSPAKRASSADLVAGERPADLVALDEALSELESLDARKGRIIELRYFAGLTIEETAALLGVAPVTVRREERRARAWLHRLMSEGEAR
jgi:DNA-directed RNA polymerase specialized sigma24 family protein